MRWSSEDDGTRIRALVHEAFAMYVPRIGKPPAPMTLDWCALSERCEVRIAECDGEVLGVLYAEERGEAYCIDTIAAALHTQGRGVGQALLRDAEELARRAGCGRLELCTNELMAENQRYYPRRGFVETGRAQQDGYARVFYAKSLS